ncbi:unnamed protein product [Clonostachys chloroleuca]|uniref:O-methyltransferase C-terminal domain-containing protein n=1 Tax=Clonostachys chloroleuca TaxID=1926264 RepID=A0AA35Q737_9HYPO|nr:unnamed protein product [Clonostachys chloroleuca]
MTKLRMPWGRKPSTDPSTNDPDAEVKKQNRQSFSGLRSLINWDTETPIEQKDSATSAPNGISNKVQEVSQLISLAKKIGAEAEKLEAYLKENGLPDPSFGVDAPGDFPKLSEEAQRSRLEIADATKELGDLVRGPRENVRWGVWSFLDTLSLQIVNNYGIAKLVPLDKPIALAELQTKTTLDPVNLARILRHNMTNHVFCEPTPGFIAHTASSRLLAQDGPLQDWVGFNSEDIFPAAASVLSAIKTYPEATSLTRTGFNVAFDTVDKEPMFATFGKDPARAKRMGGAMASLTGGEGYEVRHFVDSYDLSEIDEKAGVLVDIGGSHGFVCTDLAKKWKKMKFVVQDLPKTVDSAPKPISDDESVAERVELQAHDFFQEQPVKGADVYYFRWILHNYSAPYAIKLLKNLVPALKPGARIVINDHCLQEPGTENPWDEKLMRSMDMVMLCLLNAQERTEDEFRELFRAADERFVFKGASRSSGCRMSIIEAVWNPEPVEVVEVEEK